MVRRRRLPHWESDRGTYFVTFRLADSLPQEALRRFVFERNDILATAKRMKRDLSLTERARLKRLFSEYIEKYLDAGAEECLLARPGIAALVAEALRHFDALRYDVFAWCVMPNHVHVLLRPLEPHRLPAILHSWKSFTAKKANALLRRAGHFWQREYYDHLIRSEEEFYGVIRYIVDNPVKAGLTNWPWVWVRGSS